MAHMIANIVLIASTAFIASDPPLLPIADTSDRAIAILNAHMVEAPEITLDDYRVFQQLHVNHMKYEMMKALMHSMADKGNPGDSILVSKLGKLFDQADRDFDKGIEQWMRETKKNNLENQRREIERRIKEMEKSSPSNGK